MKAVFNGDTRERKHYQSAVEWLQEELFGSLGINLTDHQLKMANEVFFEQAKEMEKANENRLNERWAQMRHDSRIVGEKVAINWMLQIYCDVEFTEELGNEVFEEFKRYFKPQ